MSLVNGIVDAPVRWDDVRKAIGTSQIFLKDLCTHNKINMWAKYKPVRFAVRDTYSYLNNGVWEDDDEFSGQNNNPAWWWGDYDFGIDFSNTYINVSTAATGEQSMIWGLEQLVSKIDGGSNGWAYKRPRGADGRVPLTDSHQDSSIQRNEWYRVDDFKQYNSRAATPVMGARLSSDNIQTSTNGVWDLSVSMKAAEDGDINERDFIFPWDVVSLWLNKNTRQARYQMYLGMAIYKIDGNSKSALGWVTGDTDGDAMEFEGVGILNADADPDADLSVDDYKAIMKLRNGGNYAVLPFLCNKALPQPIGLDGNISKGYSVQPGGCTIYTCPNVDFMYFTATLAATTQIIGKPTLSNKDISPSNRFTSTVSIDARDTTYYQGGTIPSGRLQVLVVNNNYTYYGQDRTLENCAYEWNSTTTITVTAGQSLDVNTINNISLNPNTDWRVIINISGEYFSIALRQHPILIETNNNE